MTESARNLPFTVEDNIFVNEEIEEDDTSIVDATEYEFQNEQLEYQAEEQPAVNLPSERGFIPTIAPMPNAFVKFLTVFIVIFQLYFLVERGTTIMLQFFTLLIAAAGYDYQFPRTLATTRSLTGFGEITSGSFLITLVANNSNAGTDCPNKHLAADLYHPEFEDKIEQWRNHMVPDDAFFDIYDRA
ncbi:hypothetical protein EC973_006006, partial [Apophysomyces ossiformis]